MAKHKITVTVDEWVLARARELGDSHLSAIVNKALIEHVERLERNKALDDLIESLEEQVGPVSQADAAGAARAFEELNGGAFHREAA